jgi:hypothetical protein
MFWTKIGSQLKLKNWEIGAALSAKGQLISKCPFGVIVSTKIPMKFFKEISALASKKRLNTNIKALYFFLII